MMYRSQGVSERNGRASRSAKKRLIELTPMPSPVKNSRNFPLTAKSDATKGSPFKTITSRTHDLQFRQERGRSLEKETLILSTKAREDTWKKEVKGLREALVKAREENSELRMANRGMTLGQKEASSIDYSLYQNIFPVESELRTQSLRRKITGQKDELNNLMAENGRLKNENGKLLAELKKYKGIVKEECKQGRFKSTEFATNVKIELRRLKSRNKGSKSFTESSATTSEKLKDSASKMTNASSLRQLIDVLYAELNLLIRPTKLGIFIINNHLKDLYQKEQGIACSFAFAKTYIDLAISHYNDGISPMFKSVPSGRIYNKDKNILLIPIGRKAIYLVIQAELKTACKEKAEDLGSLTNSWVATYCSTAGKVAERLVRDFTVVSALEFKENFIHFCTVRKEQ
eukprot:TRINITY_DN1307_c0_g1_i2.p1 TRINITY_DN1307_c0_g1~~TRINITY_DN1307_c0_g1_i2.p1  ORF type:complete len:403 (-),score=94.14 TRINITY_DN1307_c0_g1_i2:828-2036(-)